MEITDEEANILSTIVSDLVCDIMDCPDCLESTGGICIAKVLSGTNEKERENET